MGAPRSRLWWMKTRRIMRVPAGDCPVEEEEEFFILTDGGEPILADDGMGLTYVETA
jgi:hypothetical protein